MNTQQQIDELKARISELEKQIEQEQSGVWIPAVGDNYYIINSCGEVGRVFNNNDKYYLHHIAIGNCFKTEQEAIDFDRRRKIRVQLERLAGGWKPDWNDGTQEKWFIAYSYKEKSLDFNYEYLYQSDDIYFPSEESAKAALAEVGEDNYKFYLGVKE